MREGQIHPAILVEVEDGDADGGGAGPGGPVERLERALTRIDPHERMRTPGHHQVDRAVVVEVCTHGRDAGAGPRQAALPSHFGEGAIAVVAPHQQAWRGEICRSGSGCRVPRPGLGSHGNLGRGTGNLCDQAPRLTDRDDEVDVVVVVVIDPGHAERQERRAAAAGGWWRQAALRGGVEEATAALVVKQENAAAGADGQIGLLVVVVVRGRAADRGSVDRETALGDALVPATRRPAKQHDGVTRLALGRRVQRQVIVRAVAVRVEHTTTSPDTTAGRACVAGRTERAGPVGDELDRDRRRGRAALGQERSRERERPLVAVAKAHRARNLLGRQPLKSLEVRFRLLAASGALKRTCQAELRRHEKGIDLEGARECRDRSVVLLDLRRHQPDEVVAVRVCGLERRGLLERRQRRLRVARALLQQARGCTRPARSAARSSSPGRAVPAPGRSAASR